MYTCSAPSCWSAERGCGRVTSGCLRHVGTVESPMSNSLEERWGPAAPYMFIGDVTWSSSASTCDPCPPFMITEDQARLGRPGPQGASAAENRKQRGGLLPMSACSADRYRVRGPTWPFWKR